MATVPGTPTTYVDGEQITASLLNAELRDSLAFLRRPPRIRVRAGATQSIPNGAGGATTALNWDTEEYKVDVAHSTAANTSRLIASTAGIYLLSGLVAFAGNATGTRYLRWAINGTAIDYQGMYPAQSASYTFPAPTMARELAAGDYLELWVGQNSGGALNVNPGSPTLSLACMLWVGAS